MATTNEIIQGIYTAIQNTHDGATDDKGEPIKIGLKREKEMKFTDRRTLDGFGVVVHGNVLRIKYHSEIQLKDLHDKGFENDISGTINDVVKYIKKEYKKGVGSALTLKKKGDCDIFAQSISRVRTMVQATCDYEIGGIKDVIPVGEPSEDRLDSAMRSWLELGKKSPKPKNVTRKQK